ncbi:MAG TPA: hypothetical protein DCL77_11310, partial [Prolixibacteraceae bacterium]|nr:hypothetical protein [Prolixibacteraceae bacterium]
VEKAKIDIENHILEFDKGHIPDSPISVASSTQLLQNDSDLAAEIVDRLSFLNYSYNSYNDNDSKKIDGIARKLWSFDEYGLISMDSLSSKLDLILNRLDEIKNK